MISVIAHRGASAACPENTVEAFREAARQGADGVELDVRRTADGVLVVRHDPLPSGDLPPGDLPAGIPTLDEAVVACEGLTVDIEVKNLAHEPDWDPSEAIAAEVAAFVVGHASPTRFRVSSFSLATVDAVRAAEPAVATGWLTLPGYDQLETVATAAAHGHSSIHPRHEAVTAELVAAAHDAGLAVVTWTVDEPDRLRALADLGVDAVITNVPGSAVDVLAPWR